MRQDQSMKKGFTLMEVMIAVVLLATTLSLFVYSFTQAKRSTVFAGNRLQAMHNARSAMEILLSYTYAATQLNNGAHLAPNFLNISNISYSVTTITQEPWGAVVKNIYLTNSWINPTMGFTSTVSLAASISQELHP